MERRILIVAICAFIGNVHLLLSQNSFYNYYDSLISEKIEYNYKETIDLIYAYEDSTLIDPNYYSYLLSYSFDRNDTVTMKKLLNRMIKDGGFISDSLTFTYRLEKFPYFDIERFNLREYCVSLYNKHHIDYIRNHPEYLFWQEIQNKYITGDKLMTSKLNGISVSFEDSCRIQALESSKSITINLFRGFESICSLFNDIPNNFDHGIYTTGRFGLFIIHFLQSPENVVEVRNLFVKYGIKTYQSGKIDSEFFHLIDKWQYDHYDTQYFGYLKDVPIVLDDKTGLHKGPYYEENIKRD